MIKYEVQGNKIVVLLGCDDTETELGLPDTIENLPVSKIAPDAFAEKKNLTAVEIPGSCKVIGPYAFASCPNLTQVILDEGVETIEDWAFINCNIKEIKLPSTIKSIGSNAFIGNKCKHDVDEYLEKINSIKKPKNHTNNKCCILPLSLQDNLRKITDTYIQLESKKIDKQFDERLMGNLTNSQLDIPFVFDGDQFLLCVFNRKAFENELTLELSSETKTKMGLYSVDDPDFLNVRVRVMSKEEEVSEFVFKSPYFENCTFDIVSKQKLEHDGMTYYFLVVKANMECYGTGNYDRQFALNMFDDLLGKFETQHAMGLIDNEQITYIRDTINNRIYVTMDGFLSQVDGAYIMTYVYNIIRAYLNDDNTDHTQLDQLLTDKLFEFYDKMSDFNSFKEICFDAQNDVMVGVEQATGKTLEDLANQYQIDVVDLLGNAMSEDDIKKAQEDFIKNQNNYTLHADFLNYVYQEMKSLNQEFSEFKYNNTKKK